MDKDWAGEGGSPAVVGTINMIVTDGRGRSGVRAGGTAGVKARGAAPRESEGAVSDLTVSGVGRVLGGQVTGSCLHSGDQIHSDESWEQARMASAGP